MKKVVILNLTGERVDNSSIVTADEYIILSTPGLGRIGLKQVLFQVRYMLNRLKEQPYYNTQDTTYIVLRPNIECFAAMIFLLIAFTQVLTPLYFVMAVGNKVFHLELSAFVAEAYDWAATLQDDQRSQILIQDLSKEKE